MNAPQLVLASGSPRRAELLRHLGRPFRIEVSAAPEVTYGVLSPLEVCLANAAAKARVVGRRFPADLVLGADTEVVMGQRVFGKPADLEEAAAFLETLAGRTHLVITGVCLLCEGAGFRRSFTVSTRVTFQPLNRRQIERYLASVNPLDKAGGYAVQEGGEWLIESLEGSLTNVVGLPVGQVRAALDALPRELQPAGA